MSTPIMHSSTYLRFATCLLLACQLLTVGATQLPRPGKDDVRVSYVNYNSTDVTLIRVQRGTATRIVLGDGEKIVRDGSATGFPADCSKAELEWCVRAEAGSNQVLVKPKDGATHNNLELRTDQRDYSFAFEVLDDTQSDGRRSVEKSGPLPMYRVIFQYAPRRIAIATMVPALAALTDVEDPSALKERLDHARPLPRNWSYSMQVLKGADHIAPSMVFDDGRFTYFRFSANRELPTIFYISPIGEEGRVNFHMDEHDPELAVVERTGKRFVLRLGGAAVGVWNDAFDTNGVAAVDGTTVGGVMRVPREGK